ncbi:MAG: hypothetical protein OS130_03125 [Thermodesulfobacteriota bacterium]|jgi:hypothetical protein|nr:MAG: hypothetical protein OS130_03125 [Thermodesulfobacteriota bacterium]
MMEKHFENLINFTLKQEALTGKARMLFLTADKWKKFAQEKNDLAVQYELLTKKSSATSADEKEGKKRVDYSTSLTISIKEPKKRFTDPAAKEKFPHMSQLCLMNCGVDILILINPHEFPKMSLEKQNETIVRELLNYAGHRTGKFLSAQQLAEKAKKIVEEFLKKVE